MTMEDKKGLIERTINVFETGVPEGRYDKLVIYDDGINDSHQITFGRSQTTEQGNLIHLIEMYVESEGEFAGDFVPYLEKIGTIPLVDDSFFKELLVRSAREDEIMRECQDRFFDQRYWSPAQDWFQYNAFELPLSMLVVYDSYIHSGRVLMFLRKRFKEYPPARGGDEKKWTTSYVETRHQWLKYHRKAILRKTVYRTQTFLNEIERDNWDLNALPINANGTDIV